MLFLFIFFTRNRMSFYSPLVVSSTTHFALYSSLPTIFLPFSSLFTSKNGLIVRSSSRGLFLWFRKGTEISSVLQVLMGSLKMASKINNISPLIYFSFNSRRTRLLHIKSRDTNIRLGSVEPNCSNPNEPKSNVVGNQSWLISRKKWSVFDWLDKNFIYFNKEYESYSNDITDFNNNFRLNTKIFDSYK